MSLLKDLNWRYATKKMTGEMVSEDQLNAILNATNLAATSYGLQPFTIVVVKNADIKAQLQTAAYGQAQVGSSSHVLVFAVPLKITAAYIQTFIDNVAATRHLSANVLDDYKNMISNTVGALSAEQQQVWATKQAYIALGTALDAAAEQKVDACPMEGFDAAAFDKILGLTEKELKSIVIMPIGFRADNDAASHFPKVRKAHEDMFIFVA
jgi:nitroreductase / dihydropteridine reductase